MFENVPDKEELILQYLDGELPQEEMKMVESKIASDANWKKIAESLSLAKEGVRFFGTVQEVNTVHQQLVNEGSLPKMSKVKVVSFPKFIRRAAAIAACIFLIAGSIVGYQFYQLSPEKVYAESFVSYQPTITRGGDQASISSIKQAYTTGEFEKVVQQSTQLIVITTEDSFLVALSFLQTNNAASSIKWLTSLASYSNKFTPDAQYYLSLSYIKAHNYDKAITQVKKVLEDEQNPYRQQFSSKTITQLKMLKWK